MECSRRNCAAIVLVGEDDSIDGPHYITHPFKEEPPWGASSVNYDLKVLLACASQSKDYPNGT